MSECCVIKLYTDGDSLIRYNGKTCGNLNVLVDGDDSDSVIAMASTFLQSVELVLPKDWEIRYGPKAMYSSMRKMREFVRDGKDYYNSANHEFSMKFSFNERFDIHIKQEVKHE